jgi:pimeloyl-ACP methyl ester carboxylesterase
MSKIVVAFIAALVVLLLAAGFWFWCHPFAVLAWVARHSLARAGFTKVEVPSPVSTQVVWERGDGPSLVFLHGAGDQAGTWSKIAPSFAGSYHVLLLDLPGHGESAPAKGPLDVGTILAGTEAVLAREALGKPLVLVGNSLGAWIALLYARAHPENVARVVLVNGGALRGDRTDVILNPANREEARRLFDLITDPGSPRVPDFMLDDAVRQARTGPLARVAATAGDMPKYLLDGRLQEITVPVDLLWGEADRLFPLDYARRMETQLPTARLTLVARCGHVPQQECPLTFRAALAKVLAEPPPEPRKIGKGGPAGSTTPVPAR